MISRVWLDLLKKGLERAGKGVGQVNIAMSSLLLPWDGHKPKTANCFAQMLKDKLFLSNCFPQSSYFMFISYISKSPVFWDRQQNSNG